MTGELMIATEESRTSTCKVRFLILFGSSTVGKLL
jgi:hypothetical protein